MQHLVNLLTNCGGRTNANSERAELIGQFTNRINSERAGTKYKELNPKFIAVKLGHLRTNEIRDFYKVCSNGGCFSKVFFGALKVRK
jgi:hypothetical protein